VLSFSWMSADEKKKPALPALPPSKPKPPTQTADGKKLAPLIMSDTEKALAAAEPLFEKCCESGDFAPIVEVLKDKRDAAVKTVRDPA
jgi:hypothetical protein